MRVQGKVAIQVDGEHERFSPTVAGKLIGTTTSDGWLVIGAEPEGDQVIWLTVEKEIEGI